MDWKLEAVVVPVSDVERSRAFYVDQLGFRLDTDHQGGPDFRVIQVTPPGSACSIIFGKGMGDGEPGSVKGNHLVVDDIEAAADQLSSAGVEHSGAQHFEAGAMVPGPDPDRASYASFIFFSDPDGNTWAVQEIKEHVR